MTLGKLMQGKRHRGNRHRGNDKGETDAGEIDTGYNDAAWIRGRSDLRPRLVGTVVAGDHHHWVWQRETTVWSCAPPLLIASKRQVAG